MVLEVHPLYGQELAVVSGRGTDAVCVEMEDGKLRRLPIAWTSLRPRRDSLEYKGKPVRLAPEALLELAAWVSARPSGLGPRDGQKVAQGKRTCENGADVKSPPRGAGSAAAMVGEARSPGAGRRIEKRPGSKR